MFLQDVSLAKPSEDINFWLLVPCEHGRQIDYFWVFDVHSKYQRKKKVESAESVASSYLLGYFLFSLVSIRSFRPGVVSPGTEAVFP